MKSFLETRTSKETGDIHYLHSAITPAIVHPDIKKVLPLMQEFISNTDGENKQDCEVNAAKRWLEKYKVLNSFKIIVMGDDLYASEPMIQSVLDKGILIYLFAKKILIKHFIHMLI